MKKVLLALVALMRTASADATTPRDDGWAAPQIVLTERPGMGLELFVIALYDDGRVLVSADRRRMNPPYATTTLTPDERRALLAGLRLDRVGVAPLPQRKGQDETTQCIVVWRDGQRRTSCLWGGFVPDHDDVGTRLAAPRELAEIWRRLSRFTPPRARPWLPPTIRVWLVAAGCEPQSAPARWPARWPMPNDDELAALRGMRGWSFSLPSSEGPALEQILRRDAGTGCAAGILVRGVTALPRYYVPLPHEAAWLRAD
jgi:hypothetical protein